MSTKVQKLPALNSARLAPGYTRVLKSPMEAMDVAINRASRSRLES
jgi:hypothetical protein